MCVLERMCLWVSVFDLVHFVPPPPAPSFIFLFFFFSSFFPTLWTPCPAAEWHSNNEWCFCSRWLYWLWALWPSLSFILLGEYFEIKEKVDVTHGSLSVFSLSLLLLVYKIIIYNVHCVCIFSIFCYRRHTVIVCCFLCSLENSGSLCNALRDTCSHVVCSLWVRELLFMFRVTF